MEIINTEGSQGSRSVQEPFQRFAHYAQAELSEIEKPLKRFKDGNIIMHVSLDNEH
jgi:hypothetical protein